MTDAETPTLLRVERGAPTPEELAALIAVLGVRRSGAFSSPGAHSRSAWAAPSRSLRGIHEHGPGVWRASSFPR